MYTKNKAEKMLQSFAIVIDHFHNQFVDPLPSHAMFHPLLRFLPFPSKL